MCALLEGKKVRRAHWTPGTFVFLNSEGVMRCGDRSGGKEGPAFAPESGEIYEEPNPHTSGTFAWAWFELKRGKLVRRAKWTGVGWCPGIRLSKEQDREILVRAFPKLRRDLRGDRVYLCPALIDATDWELVP
jgi:hypothetical protein